VKSLTVSGGAEGSSALSDSGSTVGRGVGDPGEASIPSAGWARNGIAADALPEVTAELFEEAAVALASHVEANRGAMALRRAEAQVAFLLWTLAK